MNSSLKQYGSYNHLSQVFEPDGGNCYCRPLLTQANKLAAGRTMAQTGLLSRRPGFNPCGIGGERVAVGLVFRIVLRFSSVIIVPPVLHIHPFSHHRRCIIQAIDSVDEFRMHLHAHIQTHTE